MTSSNAGSWAIRRKPNACPELRLFCFPHAGAGSVIFHDWHNAFPNGVEVCAIEPPGKLVRRHEPSPGSIFEFAQAAAHALAPLLDVPFAVFGYSLGALMAFEWLRVVRQKQGREATHLVTAACAAPHLQRRLSPISGEPDPIFVRELEHRYGPFDAVIKGDPALFEVIVKIMRRDMAMLESYHYQNDEPFACPLLALGGAADPSVLPDELQAWNAQTQAKFAQRHFPGGHFFLRSSGQALRETILEHILSMKRSTEPAPPVFS